MTPDELKQIGDLFDEKTGKMRRHVDESAAETRRHFDVVAEALTEKICIVGEGHVMLNEKLDRMKIEDEGRHQEVTGRLDHLEVRVGNVEDRVEGIDQKVEGIDGRLAGMEHELTEFHAETRSGFDEVRSAIRFSYAELDRRVSTLESELVGFATRLDRVEALVAR